jgi:hypothetical protein
VEAQAILAYGLLAIWYLTGAVADVLGFIVRHWFLSIVLIGFTIIAMLSWNSERTGDFSGDDR